jgi:2-amino-4-ketopentanoate thiolase alpha subunit
MPDSPGAPAADPSAVRAGEWVEIERVVLPAGGRAPNVPADTAEVDFVARIRGFLVEPTPIGTSARVRTLLDREVSGRLAAVNPRNPANFGDPVPSLLRLGLAARRSLEETPSR